MNARAKPVLGEALHVAPIGVLAMAAADAAKAAAKAVFQENLRGDRAIANFLRERRDLALPDHRFIAQSVFAMFRWHGWTSSLKWKKFEEGLLIACLLDSTIVHPVHRYWAHMVNRNPDGLVPLGDAPNWTAYAEGLKRFVGGRTVNADPWRLFPEWLRDVLPPSLDGTNTKTRNLEFLLTLQKRPPLWVRAQGPQADAVWTELKEAGVSPWIHRRLERAAKLPTECDVHHLPAFERGAIEIQDLASQAVSLVCDPEPGERWWDACAGAAGKSLHLADLMKGKGLVVATDSSEYRLKEAVRRARRSPFRNVTTKLWKGKGVAGKAGSFDGVLVDAPCSGIGTWRRNPDARWTLEKSAVDRLATLQAELLAAAAAGVKPGGTLVYSVCTVTTEETTGVIQPFLRDHPEFVLDRVQHPIDEVVTNGAMQIWPQAADSDAMFIARMIRTRA